MSYTYKRPARVVFWTQCIFSEIGSFLINTASPTAQWRYYGKFPAKFDGICNKDFRLLSSVLYRVICISILSNQSCHNRAIIVN